MVKRAEIISISNQKGGVGKTTTVINLATYLAMQNKKVLILDIDPQGNASTGLGINENERDFTAYNLIMEEGDCKACIKKTKIPNLHIVPSNMDLSSAEIELANSGQRTFALKNKISELTQIYDYIIIDCPPSMGLLTLNALTASDSVIIPMQCEFFALEGINHLIKTISKVKSTVNPNLEIKGVLLTMYDRRNKLSELVRSDIRACFNDKMFETFIPRNVKLSEAPSHGLSIAEYDKNCAGAESYEMLVREILLKDKKNELKEAA